MTISWVLWIVLDRDVPEGQSLPEPEPVLDYIKVAIKSPGVWLISIGVGFGLASTTAYAGFLPQALQLGKGIDVATAGFMAAIVTVGSFFGCIVGPAFCDKLGKFKGFLIVTTLIGAISMFVSGTPRLVSFCGRFWSSMASLPPSTARSCSPCLSSFPRLVISMLLRWRYRRHHSLLMSYFLPIGISAIAGADYTMNMGLESLCFLLSVVPVFFLPSSAARPCRLPPPRTVSSHGIGGSRRYRP